MRSTVTRIIVTALAPKRSFFSPICAVLSSVAAHGDKAQMVGAYLGRLPIVKVAPQLGSIGCVG